MSWNRRPLPGSIEEAALKIGRLFELEEQQRWRPQSRNERPAEPAYVPKTGLLSPTLTPPRGRSMGSWAMTARSLPQLLTFPYPVGSVAQLADSSGRGALTAQKPVRADARDLVGLFDIRRAPRPEDFEAIPSLVDTPAPMHVPWWLIDVRDGVLAPTTEPVDVLEWAVRLGFNPTGPGEFGAAVQDPFGFPSTGKNALRARWETDAQFPDDDFPQNDEADAFRHAVWAFRLMRSLGDYERAKQFNDSHEISSPNSPGVRLMDLFNARVGMLLAMDSSSRERPPADVVREALESGLLQTQPFAVRTSRGAAPAGAR